MGPCKARSPHSTAWALEPCCSQLFPDVCVVSELKAQRGAVPSPGSADVVEVGSLPGSLGSWSTGGSSQISGRPLVFLCLSQPISTPEKPGHWCDLEQVTPQAEPVFPSGRKWKQQAARASEVVARLNEIRGDNLFPHPSGATSLPPQLVL